MTKWLNDDEIQAVIMATIAGNSGQATDQQIIKAVDWAEGVRINVAVLDTVLSGKLHIMSPTKGDVMFIPPDEGGSIK